jgi:hypothetical protein
MAMPGFTADASLYAPGAIYRMVATAEAFATGNVVAPQACVNIGPCRVCINIVGVPPRACVSFSCLGFSRNFCIP